MRRSARRERVTGLDGCEGPPLGRVVIEPSDRQEPPEGETAETAWIPFLLDQVWAVDEKVAASTKEELKAAGEQLQESRRKLKAAAGKDAAKTRAAVQRALDAIKRRSAELAKKLHPSCEAAPAHP